MNKKTSILSFAALIAGILFYQAGPPRPSVSGLRDAVADSALDGLRSAGPQNKAGHAPIPLPVAQSVSQPGSGPVYKADPAFDAAVPADIKQQLLQDLGFAGTITSKKVSALHNSIFGLVSGQAYTKYFEDRVKSVGMSGCGSALAVACVIPFKSNTKMWLTQNYIKFSHPQIARIMLVFHESRHTEAKNGNWRHANCPDPFTDANGQDVHSIWTGASLVGESGACDITPYGSYGSSLIMLKNIQKFCANCTEKVQMDAGMYADDQLNRIVDAKAKKAIQADLYNK
ncbi:MAG TPA: hypothetical protein DCZ92_11490 [Elusimicrobia bacterium]|nr:hypothetical protein [Elusimicrobiota bacterium]